MAEIKLTKNEWREQKQKLDQLQKYLPTLQLKKALLQAEIQEARQQTATAKALFDEKKAIAFAQSGLISEENLTVLKASIKIASLEEDMENIAGVLVPRFLGVRFEEPNYSLLDTPAWTEGFVALMQDLISANIRKKTEEIRQEALEEEFKEVSIKVNLFEKILIPRALKNIRKIKVFLSDQVLAAISQSKVAKRNIERYLQKKKTEGQTECGSM